jgi:P22 coat protein - gene protein 5
MANSYLTSTLISKEAVAIFQTENSFMEVGYKGSYEKDFSDARYKTKDTINVRLDNFFELQRGDVVTSEDIVEASIPLTILPLFSIPISYTPTDLTRDIADFGEEVLKPAVRTLIAGANKVIADNAKYQVTNFIGDPSAYVNTFTAFDAINVRLDQLGANGYDRYASLNPQNAGTLRGGLANFFNSSLNEKIVQSATLGNLAGIDVMKDNAISRHVAGTHAASGPITVKTTVANGATIVLTGLSTGATFKKGDRFTIADVMDFDKIYRQPLSFQKQFIVAADVTTAGADATLTLSEALVSDTSRQNYIVNSASPNQIPANAVVTFVGNYTANVGYTTRGLITVMPALDRMDSPDSYVETDKKYGVSLRVSKTAEVLNNKNIMRLDMQMATAWVPGQSVVLMSA